MSLCLNCYSNSAQTTAGLNAGTTKQQVKANPKHLLLVTCNPVGGAAWFDDINAYYAGNTAANAANAIYTALTAPLYRNIVVAMPQLVTFDITRNEPTKTEGTCGTTIYSSAGVSITATNLISDCTLPTDAGLAETFDMEQIVAQLNGSEYKKLLVIDCAGYIWYWFASANTTTDSSLMDFNPRFEQHSQKINGCEQITGWKGSFENTCNQGYFKRVINLNAMEADVQEDFRALGLL